ncbi:MAG: FAD-dependent oxidoreductase [Verrucomicrobia bacterium]|nr:FAD-dependent oxidoreductase [Verrucomicrobiota bacterium]
MSVNFDYKTQVLVVGAGSAGVTAALAAARNGATTLLIERSGFLGGISATLPWLGFHDREYRQVVKGLAQEFVRDLVADGDAVDPCLDPKCGSTFSFNFHAWKIMAMRKMEEAGVKVLLHAVYVDTLRENDRITGVVIETKTGRQNIGADVVIDCSGDGDVAARGGLTWEKGRTKDGLVQSPTLVFRIGGVNRQELVNACKDPAYNYREWLDPYPDVRERFVANLDDLPSFIFGGFADLMQQARDAGELDVPQSRVVGVKLHEEDEFMAVMTRVLGLDPTNVDNMSNAFSSLYKQVTPIMNFFRKWVPGFSQCVLREIAPIMGVRESRRIIGDYILTGEDVIAGTEFEDAVSMGGYHIDIHRPSGSWVESYNVQAYTIPLRSLISKDAENLLMAGKCISATHEAIGSTRVIPICMGQAQAVGTVSAMAVNKNKSVRDISVHDLQNTLIDQGAEIGQSLGEPNLEAIEKYGQLPLEDAEKTSGEGDPVTSGAWLSSKREEREVGSGD